MKVVSYLGVIPAKNTNQEKADILKKYILGVNTTLDLGVVYNGTEIQDCDVAVIQGWQHEQGKTASHLKLRSAIITHQLSKNKFVCVADSNLFLYANKDNSPHHYLRYSFNGVFPNTGIYCDTEVDPKRWDQISTDLGINLKNRKNNGRHILICLQRNGGWSMGNINVVEWTRGVVQKIKQHSDRPILLRTHPGDKSVNNYMQDLLKIPNIKISKIGTSLEKDLKDAWCVVNHNSSSIVGPIIMGYPAFITDSPRSQCKDVSHSDFSKIESPREFDRDLWVKRLSMFHWKFSELEDGSCWRHMRNYCQ
jgi:hypothetical protein